MALLAFAAPAVVAVIFFGALAFLTRSKRVASGAVEETYQGERGPRYVSYEHQH
jgi:hypothetical protein